MPTDSDLQVQILDDLGGFHDADDTTIVNSSVVSLVWGSFDPFQGQALIDLRTRQKILRDTILPKLASKVNSTLAGFQQSDSDEYKAASDLLSSLNAAIMEVQTRQVASQGPRAGLMTSTSSVGPLPGGVDPNLSIFRGDPRFRRRWGW